MIDAAKPAGRRKTAAALRGQIDDMLLRHLPTGWSHQLMPTAGPVAKGREDARPDILVISPSGRCHFLFTKAPEDRWWDGDIRRVSAESLSAAERALIGRLKRGGHAVRAVWRRKDALRALASWGCRLRRETASAASEETGTGLADRARPVRAKLTLNFGGAKTDER